MIFSILSECWKYDVVLSVVDGNIKAEFQKENFPDKLRFQIKQNKPLLLERIKQNDQLKREGWFVGCFGDIYEYRLSFQSYLYIERETEQSFTLWRRTQNPQGKGGHKILLEQSSYDEVYRKAVDYISWWNSKQRKAVV